MNYNDRDFVAMALPSVHDVYYRHNYNALIKLYHEMMIILAGLHKVHIHGDPASLAALKSCGTIPAGVKFDLSFPHSPWIRDYMPIYGRNGWVKPIYKPSYQPQTLSAKIDLWANKWLTENKVGYKPLQLVIDGGNIIISPDQTVAILTEKVFHDNPDYLRDNVASMISEAFGINRFIVLPCENRDITGHVDSMCRWISNDTLLINRYPSSFRSRLMSCLQAKLPSDTKIVEIPYCPSSSEFAGFPSASGAYLNFLKTSKCCIIPTFCDVQRDRKAFQLISEYCDVPCLQVNSEAISKYGGVLNCISWN